jgi:hypothetical protein
MPKLSPAGHGAFASPFQTQPLTIAFLPPAQSIDAISLTQAARRILRSAYEDLLRKPAILENFDMFDQDNFDIDTDMPLTIEMLAAKHRHFLAADRREWSDIDLPELP